MEPTRDIHSSAVKAFVSRVCVLLADDNSAILEEASRVLEEDYDIVAAVKDGLAVISECLRLRPDIVVLDISMGDVSGIDLARQINDLACYCKIIFLSVHEDCAYVNAAIGAGARAYVVKSRLSTDLITAVRAVMVDKLFVSNNLLYARE